MSDIKTESFSYNTKLSYTSRLQVKLKVPIKFRDDTKILHKNINREIDFIVDTGATHSIIPAYQLGITDEDKFKKAYGVDCGEQASGILSNITLEYFTFWLDYMRFGDIIIKEPIISISFNKGVQCSLLGMDILSLFILNVDPENRIISLTETGLLHDLIRADIPINEPTLVDPRIVPPRLNLLDLEAHYIDKLLRGG